jgi:hypothetical protein
MFTAIFSKPSRPLKHMGAAVQRYGLVQVSFPPPPPPARRANLTSLLLSRAGPGGSGELPRRPGAEDCEGREDSRRWESFVCV